MSREEFLEALLQIMEQKIDPAWPAFTSGRVPPGLLHIHLEQEYGTYILDFPVLIGRAYVQCPIPEVRRELAENLYEEETGGVCAGRPHPELFLEIPRALKMDLGRFHHAEMLPASRRYRSWLDEATGNMGWEIGCAVATLFVEGTRYERGEVDDGAARRPVSPLEEHPLVLHYNLPVEALALTKAHREVEGEHRDSAWKIVTEYISPERRSGVIEAMQETLNHWIRYRRAVAVACGVG